MRKFAWPATRTMRSPGLLRRCHRIAAAHVRPGIVRLTWSDGRVSDFHHEWLRDHCPQSLHPVSNQREVSLRQLKPGLAPDAAAVKDGPAGQALELRWPARLDPSGAEHTSTFCASWLRERCYSGTSPAVARERGAAQTLWAAGDFAGGLGLGGVPAAVSFRYRDVLAPGRAGEERTLACLGAVRRYGFAVVRQTPGAVGPTEALARRLGVPQPTFYGEGDAVMWDTAPRPESDVHDTAYSNAALPLHTDCSYLEHTPGLQLFNCVEQPAAPPGVPLAGGTRLADGFHAAAVLKRRHPASFDFLCRAAVPFHHVEGDVHMEHVAPIFATHPLSAEVVGVRYNETDRAPLDTLPFDDVPLFYRHVAALHGVLDESELALRLEPGDAIVINNHRVLHGRHAFVGRRNLIGCYLTADDWQSRLRVLERRLGGEAEPPEGEADVYLGLAETPDLVRERDGVWSM